MKLIIKTMAGLEQVLADELTALGAGNIEPATRAVVCEGNEHLLYRANLELRTALRVLVPIAEFNARDEDELYHNIRQIDWSQYMDLEDTLAVDAVTNSRRFSHSKFAALKTKDAIVDQFRQRKGVRPNVDIHNPSLRINLHIWRDQCTVALDASGDSLHKRGYRMDALAAPLNEVLAAGLVLLTGWQRDCTYIDPMCGSGTILIEAALYAYNIPPLLQRRQFGFMKWKNYDAGMWGNVVRQARDRIVDFPHQLLGFDQNFKAVKACQQNAFAAHLEGKVKVERQPFERLVPPAEIGLLIMNPPYDERMTKGDIGSFYNMIGDRLKQHFAGYEAWIISSNKEALKRVGLRPSRKITVYNGALECKYQKYDLYRGSRKVVGS